MKKQIWLLLSLLLLSLAGCKGKEKRGAGEEPQKPVTNKVDKSKLVDHILLKTNDFALLGRGYGPETKITFDYDQAGRLTEVSNIFVFDAIYSLRYNYQGDELKISKQAVDSKQAYRNQEYICQLEQGRIKSSELLPSKDFDLKPISFTFAYDQKGKLQQFQITNPNSHSQQEEYSTKWEQGLLLEINKKTHNDTRYIASQEPNNVSIDLSVLLSILPNATDLRPFALADLMGTRSKLIMQDEPGSQRRYTYKYEKDGRGRIIRIVRERTEEEKHYTTTFEIGYRQ